MSVPYGHDRPVEARPHFVYRYYDADEQPLYIGCTTNVRKREYGHRSKEWFPLVARREIEWFPDMFHGRMAERAAIQREQPRFNSMHTQEPVTERGISFHEEWSRNPGKAAELIAKYYPKPTPEDIAAMHEEETRERVYWARVRRRLKESRFRSDQRRAS